MYCSKCGHKNPDEALFCGECGSKLAPVVKTQEKEPERVEEVQAQPVYSEEIEEEATVLLEPEDIPEPVSAPEPTPEPIPEPQPVQPVFTAPPAPEPQPVQPVYEQPQTPRVQPIHTIPVQPVYNANVAPKASPVVEALKKVARSPMMIVAAICFILNSVFSFIYMHSSFNVVYTATAEAKRMQNGISSMFGGYGYNQYNSFDSAANAGLSVVNIIFIICEVVIAVLMLLMVVGLIHTLIQGFTGGNKFSTVGLSMMKGTQITMLVFACISAVLTLISFISVAKYGFGDEEISALITVLVVYAFAIVYSSLVIISLGKAKKMAKYNIPGKASAFVGVMQFVAAALTTIMLIVVLVAMDEINGAVDELMREFAREFGYYDPSLVPSINIGIVSMILSILSSLSFGIVIFSQRGKVNELNYINR